MKTLLELGHCLVFTADASTQLVENALLLCLPIAPAAFFERAVELLLRLFAALLNGGDEVLLVRDAKVSRNIGVLQRLQRREGGGWIQMRDRVGEC